MSSLYRDTYPDGIARRVIDNNELYKKKIEKLLKDQKAQKKGGFVEGIAAIQLGEEDIEEKPPEPQIDLEEIQRQADEILQNAEKKSESIIKKANKDAEGIRENARQEGYETGYAEGRQKADEELENQRNEFLEKDNKRQMEYDRELEMLEPKLLDAILTVVEKVFHIQFDDKREVLLYLIKNTLSNIEGGREFKIRVNGMNFAFLDSHKDEIMERVGHESQVDFVSDPTLMENQCMIETGTGMFECGLDVQMENLIKDLRSLCT